MATNQPQLLLHNTRLYGCIAQKRWPTSKISPWNCCSCCFTISLPLLWPFVVVAWPVAELRRRPLPTCFDRHKVIIVRNIISLDQKSNSSSRTEESQVRVCGESVRHSILDWTTKVTTARATNNQWVHVTIRKVLRCRFNESPKRVNYSEREWNSWTDFSFFSSSFPTSNFSALASQNCVVNPFRSSLGSNNCKPPSVHFRNVQMKLIPFSSRSFPFSFCACEFIILEKFIRVLSHRYNTRPHSPIVVQQTWVH